VKVSLRNPDRELEVADGRRVRDIVEECPLVAGNTQLRYKEAMNRLEATSPGTKASFYLGYLDRAQMVGERLGASQADRPSDEQVSAEFSDEVLPAEIYSGGGA
jgi:hypothetical protein